MSVEEGNGAFVAWLVDLGREIRNQNWDYIWLWIDDCRSHLCSHHDILCGKCSVWFNCSVKRCGIWLVIAQICFFSVFVWPQRVHEHPIAGGSGRMLAHIRWSIITGDSGFSSAASHTCESSNSSRTAWDTLSPLFFPFHTTIPLSPPAASLQDFKCKFLFYFWI